VMAAKHTPLPWKLHPVDDTTIIGPELDAEGGSNDPF